MWEGSKEVTGAAGVDEVGVGALGGVGRWSSGGAGKDIYDTRHIV